MTRETRTGRTEDLVTPGEAFRLIVQDPGKLTGCFRLDVRARETWGEWEQLELPCWEAVEWAEDAVCIYPVPQMVVESFFINAQTLRKTREHWSLEAIGATRYVARRAGIDFTLQPPSDKAFGTRAKLERLGWRMPTRGDHADDAASHALKRLLDMGRLRLDRVMETED